MNGSGGTIAELVAATRRWVEQPFSTTMDLGHWFLIVGVLLVSALLWSRILARLGE
jgi:hypothetical protein